MLIELSSMNSFNCFVFKNMSRNIFSENKVPQGNLNRNRIEE